MNTADNQAQNSNYNPHNPNLTNPSSKKFTRDYDKEPIIIKSYERFFVCVIYFVPLAFSGLFVSLVFYDEKANYFEIAAVIFVLTIIAYIFTAARTKHEIRLTNRYIDFVDNGTLKRRCRIDEEELSLSFALSMFVDGAVKKPKSNKIFFFIIALMMLIAWQGMAVAMVFFIYLSNIILKLIIYLFLNKNLKGFKFFPFLRVANPSFGEWFQYKPVYPRYFFIYFYNKKVYEEICRWFLQNGVNIDYIKKDYLFI